MLRSGKLAKQVSRWRNGENGTKVTYKGKSHFTHGVNMQIIGKGMDAIVVRTEHWPEAAKPFLKDYWLAWANGVQSDGETEQQAIDNAQAALERGDPVDPAYRP